MIGQMALSIKLPAKGLFWLFLAIASLRLTSDMNSQFWFLYFLTILGYLKIRTIFF